MQRNWKRQLSAQSKTALCPELGDFAKKLEKATLGTIEDGIMTGDLAKLASPEPKKIVNSWEFIDEIASRLN